MKRTRRHGVITWKTAYILFSSPYKNVNTQE